MRVLYEKEYPFLCSILTCKRRSKFEGGQCKAHWSHHNLNLTQYSIRVNSLIRKTERYNKRGKDEDGFRKWRVRAQAGVTKGTPYSRIPAYADFYSRIK